MGRSKRKHRKIGVTGAMTERKSKEERRKKKDGHNGKWRDGDTTRR